MSGRSRTGRADGRRSRGNAPARSGTDAGGVTVEAAVALSSLVVVLALCLAAIAVLIAQVRVVDAAREAARLAARGDETAARQAVTQLAPHGSTLSLTGADMITARVQAPPLGVVLPGIRVDAEAIARREPEGQLP